MTTDKTLAKRIVLVGGCGGAGKSAIARAIADYLDARKVSYTGYEACDACPTFQRFFHEAVSVSPAHDRSLEVFGAAVGSSHQLVDLAPNDFRVLSQLYGGQGLPVFAQANGARVVLLFALRPDVAGIAKISELCEQYGSSIDYVIARDANYNRGDPRLVARLWERWSGSAVRDRLRVECGAREIFIPMLDGCSFSFADQHSLRWAAAATDSRVNLFDQRRYSSWLADVFAEFDKAELIPGIADQKVVA